MAIAGYIAFTLGAFITLLNLYLSFVRYPIHVACGGTRESYLWISGIPLFGSVLLWLCIPLLPSVGFRWLAAFLSVFDTDGIHWFAVSMLLGLCGHYNVYGWNHYLRFQHPEVAQACDLAARFCLKHYPSKEIIQTVVRAVELHRDVIAVVAAEPGLIWRGRPPYHLVAVNRSDGVCQELPDEPPYCFFGVK